MSQVTGGDKVEAQRVFGYTVSGYGIGNLTDRMAQFSNNEVSKLVSEYRNSYTIAPAHDRPDSLAVAARIELGLRAFLTEGGFGAFTDTFEDLHGMGQFPGIATQRLMASGFGFGGERDWKTAALVRIMKVMAGGMSGGTSFMDDYTYDFADTPKTLGSHMLESALYRKGQTFASGASARDWGQGRPSPTRFHSTGWSSNRRNCGRYGEPLPHDGDLCLRDRCMNRSLGRNLRRRGVWPMTIFLFCSSYLQENAPDAGQVGVDEGAP